MMKSSSSCPARRRLKVNSGAFAQPPWEEAHVLRNSPIRFHAQLGPRLRKYWRVVRRSCQGRKGERGIRLMRRGKGWGWGWLKPTENSPGDDRRGLGLNTPEAGSYAASAATLTADSASWVRAASVSFSSFSVLSSKVTASVRPSSCAQVLSVP